MLAAGTGVGYFKVEDFETGVSRSWTDERGYAAPPSQSLMESEGERTDNGVRDRDIDAGWADGPNEPIPLVHSCPGCEGTTLNWPGGASRCERYGRGCDYWWEPEGSPYRVPAPHSFTVKVEARSGASPRAAAPLLIRALCRHPT